MAGPPVDGGKAPRIPEQGNVLQRMINVPAVWQVCWALLVVPVSDRNRQPDFQLPQVALWTVLFYFSSAVSGMMNKQIIADYGILPTTLTMWHLLISVACDSACCACQLAARCAAADGTQRTLPCRLAQAASCGPWGKLRCQAARHCWVTLPASCCSSCPSPCSSSAASWRRTFRTTT